MNSIVISNRRRIAEISAVFLTGAGKFIFMDWLQWKLPFVVTAMIGWSAYVLMRRKEIPGIMKHWGFRFDNFGQVLMMVFPFAILAVLVCFISGYFLGNINLSWHILPILILYPTWGIIQQFLIIGLVAGNMKELKQKRYSDFTIILVTALLFGVLHYPSYWLILGTFVLALFYGYIYLKGRNVYVMGIFHGWLGALFFYTVVGRDPFIEVFGKLIR